MSNRISDVAFLLMIAASVAYADQVQLEVKLADLEGKAHTPLNQPKSKATVIFFLLPDCPISNAYAPEINRIATEYAKRGVASFVVYVDPDLSIDDAQKHAGAFGYECPVLRDTKLELVKQTGVSIAPEAVVFGPDAQIRYRGRIDDLYTDYGKRRIQPSQRDLRDAVDAVLAGREVTRKTTKAIGCHIVK